AFSARSEKTRRPCFGEQSLSWIPNSRTSSTHSIPERATGATTTTYSGRHARMLRQTKRFKRLFLKNVSQNRTRQVKDAGWNEPPATESFRLFQNRNGFKSGGKWLETPPCFPVYKPLKNKEKT